MESPAEFATRALAAAGRAAARLAPTGRRDWVQAVWAEAYEVPSGLRRLAWLAGGVRVIATEALMARRIGRWLLFAAAAAVAARATWPGSPGSLATVVARIDVVTIVLLLAGLPWLARRFLGPASNSRLPRVLRAGAYAAVMALIVAKASVSQVVYAPATGVWQAMGGPAREFDWFGQIIFLVVMAGYVAAILAVTAGRPRVAPATLAIGTSAGIVLGVVMFAVAPLGLAKDATEPWLAGSAIDPVVALAWILLLGGPVAAGGVAGRRYRGPASSPGQLANAKIGQGAVAGVLATGVGALIVTVLGTGTVALMPRAAWLRQWLYPGQHLQAAAAHSHQLAAGKSVGGYGLILLIFPVIGFLLGMASAVPADSATSPGPSPGGGGPPGPDPVPDSPDGGRLAGAGAGTDGPAAGLAIWSEEDPDSEHDEVLAGATG